MSFIYPAPDFYAGPDASSPLLDITGVKGPLRVISSNLSLRNDVGELITGISDDPAMTEDSSSLLATQHAVRAHSSLTASLPVAITAGDIGLLNSLGDPVTLVDCDGTFAAPLDSSLPTSLAVSSFTAASRSLVEGTTSVQKDGVNEKIDFYAGGVLSLSLSPTVCGIEQSATYLYNQLQIRLPDFSAIMTLAQQPDGLHFLSTLGSTTTAAAAITSTGLSTIAATISGPAPALTFIETPANTPCTLTFDNSAISLAISGSTYLSLNATYLTANRPLQLGDPLATTDTYLIFNAAGTYTLWLKRLGNLYNLYETSQLATTINNRLILTAGVTIAEVTMNGSNTITATPASDLTLLKPRYRCANVFSFLRAGGQSPNFTQIGALPYYGWEFINNNYSLYSSFTIPADVADTTTVLPTIQGTYQTVAAGNVHWRLTFNRPTTGAYLSPAGDVTADVVAAVGVTAYAAVTISFTESPLWASLRGSTALCRLQRINDALDTYGGSFWLTGFCFRYHCGYLAGFGGP